ncbi:MAG TPA: flagellum-specific ATP synthase FliI, partial [Eubacteriaceae bacterium]|nr:flagellum-specific ATP synthase FliI [Eubacteriaceae bacterium]
MDINFDCLHRVLEEDQELYYKMGKVKQVVGLIIHAVGLDVFVGEVCYIFMNKRKVQAEVVGFRDGSVLLMPLGDVEGIGPGCMVLPTGETFNIKIGDDILASTLDGLGRPMDLVPGRKLKLNKRFSINRTPPNPFQRRKIEDVMKTGVKAIDGVLTCGEGQRIG